jgi:cell wall-associated NlpC family hydrolase
MLARAVKYLCGGMLLAITLAACSSSSFSGRYNKSKPKVTPPSKTVRFTSETDSIPEKEKTVKYSDPQSGEFDQQPVEDFKIDKKEFVKKYKYLGQLGAALTPREKLLFEIVKYLDTPYQYGGNSLHGIDCSAFTQNVFEHALGLNLPRTAREQFGEGEKVSRNELEFGDLIFFNTTTRSYPGHVGIYLGNDLFAHASQSQGVIVSSLNSKYYAERFIEGRKIFDFNKLKNSLH